MLKCICNCDDCRFAHVLESCLSCEANFMNDGKISSITKSFVKYKSDFSEFVKQDVGGAGGIFLSICEIGSIYLLNCLVSCHYDALNKVKCKRNFFHDNALHLAVWYQHPDVVDILLERLYFPNGDLANEIGKSILNGMTKLNETPVVHACRRKSRHSLAILNLLLNYKCTMAPTEKNNLFPILSATCYNHVTILRYMIDNDIGMDTINMVGGPDSCTPLHIQQSSKIILKQCKYWHRQVKQILILMV